MGDTQHVTRNTWYVIQDMWYITCDTWHVWEGKASLSLTLSIGEWRCFKDIFTRDESVRLRFIWPYKSDCPPIFPKMQRIYSLFAKLWFVRRLIFQIRDYSPQYLSQCVSLCLWMTGYQLSSHLLSLAAGWQVVESNVFGALLQTDSFETRNE